MIKLGLLSRTFVLSIVTLGAIVSVVAQPRRPQESNSIPKPILLQIIRAEDERRWDSPLADLLQHESDAVRTRAALAAGRIGNELAVPALVSLLQSDKNYNVQSMAAFALGETEAASAGDALLGELGKRNPPAKGRIIEALGKITAALPATDATRLSAFRKAILGALEFEAGRRSALDGEVISLGVTAALRARPEGAGAVIAEFLTYGDPGIRADAANALARLRAKDGNAELRKRLTSDQDAVVRANAARVLGATVDREGLERLVNAALKDEDPRVRVSAVRSLAAFREDATAKPLFEKFLNEVGCQRYLIKVGKMLMHHRDSECLEIATTLGRIFQGSGNKSALTKLQIWNGDFEGGAPEMEVALARISPQEYLEKSWAPAVSKGAAWVPNEIAGNWHVPSSIAQALADIATFPDSTPNKKELSSRAEAILRGMLDASATEKRKNSPYAVPDVLRALAAFKPTDLESLLRNHLLEPDVVIRTTAAELLADRPSMATNIAALGSALTVALRDKDSNDAALAILDALGKQKNSTANESIKTALDSSDYLVRRKAVDSLKAAGAGDFSDRIGPVKSRNTSADYARAVNRIGKRGEATVTTSKGTFTIEFLPEKAPLTVDNFVQLAKRGYFNGIVFHRVVPNFVVQGGDPRGDGNGGPGYAIRCEINEVPYGRGALGMALSGKDTGGSQWFVTHSPQPHLDGGYTVFGRVIKGMDVVDNIVRGDTIKSIRVTESTVR